MKLDTKNNQFPLSDESQQQIENLFKRLEYLLSPLGTWRSEHVKTAIFQVLQGEISLQEVSGARNKIACKLMCELIKYIYALEAQIKTAKNESSINANNPNSKKIPLYTKSSTYPICEQYKLAHENSTHSTRHFTPERSQKCRNGTILSINSTPQTTINANP